MSLVEKAEQMARQSGIDMYIHKNGYINSEKTETTIGVVRVVKLHGHKRIVYIKY